MAWMFFYAASQQVFDQNFSVAGFLKGTKTFHDVYAPLTNPTCAPVLTFLVAYGHLLIGLSLLFGLMVRVSVGFGILLMLVYWTAYMDFPYIEDQNNFLLDYHLIYAGVLVYLLVKCAGHVCSLDSWFDRLSFFAEHLKLRPFFA